LYIKEIYLGFLGPNHKDNKRRNFRTPRCNICNIKLVPIRFIVACEDGHVDDFPWEKWVHYGSECSQKCDLRFNTNPGVSGLNGINVKCENKNGGTGCGKSRNMSGAFNSDIHKKLGGCSGKKPWVRINGESKKEKCTKIPRTVQKGASNVYFPYVKSSILIPPYSDNIYNKLEKSDLWKMAIKKENEKYLEDIAEEYNIDIEYLEKIFKKRIDSNIEGKRSEIEYRYDEYKAFLGQIGEGNLQSDNFDVELKDVSLYGIDSLENVALVKKLREIRTLESFSRLSPVETDIHEEKQKIDSKSISVSENKNVNWLPAIEVRGEGIFIQFNEKDIQKWENKSEVKGRIKKINDRILRKANKRDISPRILPAKFILLHTLAHILIRQLNFECGYSSSALRERIYCNENEYQPVMSGILIYTSSGDSEGTLGGLVKQGEPEYFTKIFEKAINKASWCSSDPLCIENEGQGLNSLNLAACHACSLLPETSCEEFNRFLDRGMLIGKLDSSESGFFNSFINKI
jgi:hypothetical protein